MKSSSRIPAATSGALDEKRKPAASPTASMITSWMMLVPTSADPPGDDRRAPHRQRAEAVDQSFLEVLGEAERGHEAAEGDRLNQDSGDQVVDVAVVTGVAIAPPKT